MKNIIQYICFSFLFFLLGSIPIHAQLYINDALIDVEEGISDEVADQVVKSAASTIKAYALAAEFKDERTQKISQNSIKKFKNLFTQSAKIVDDLSKFIINDKNYADYASKVRDFLGGEGVDFKMYAAQFKELTYDSAGYYQIEIHTEKTLYNGVEVNGDILKCKTGRVYFLKFFLHVQEDNLEEAKIFRIRGEIVRSCEDAVASFGVNLRYGQDFLKMSSFEPFSYENSSISKYKPHLIDSDKKDKFPFRQSPKLEYVLTLGGTLNLPITKKELLFLSLNLNASYYKLRNSIEGTYHFEHKNPNVTVFTNDNTQTEGLSYLKQVQITAGEENINLVALEFPIGLLYKKSFIANDKLKVGAYLYAIPTLSIFSFNNYQMDLIKYQALIFVEALGSSTPIVLDSDDNISNKNRLDNLGLGYIGQDNENGKVIVRSKPTLQTNFSLSGRISPFVQYKLKENMFLELAVDYTHNFNNFFKAAESPSLFLADTNDDLDITDELTQSSFETQFSSTHLHNIGVRIGVLWKLNK